MNAREASEKIRQSWVLRRCYSRNPQEACLWAIPLSIAFLAVGFFGTRNVLLCAALWVAGALYWTLMEYFLHRFAFHWIPKSKKLHDRVYPIHEHHHDLPNDLSIVTAGPMFGIPMGAIWYALTALALGPWFAASLMSGVAFGYLFYEWVHYEAHAGVHKTGWMGYLKRYHLTHHHIAPNECFGVTSPFWDKVFRTEFKTTRQPHSAARKSAPRRSSSHSIAR